MVTAIVKGDILECHCHVIMPRELFPVDWTKMGVTIGILANQHMGRQRTTYDISHFGHVIVFQFLCCIY